MRLLKLSALVALVLFSAVGFLALLAVRSLPASGGGGAGGQVASGNGDVNCDGTLNITDAILVLEHLFRGGQEPCAIAQGGPGFPEVVAQLERLNGSLSGANVQLDKVLAMKWPPRPEDIVNLRVHRTGTAPLDPVFTVPLESFLVVTDLSFVARGNTPGNLFLDERRDSLSVPKLHLERRPTVASDSTDAGADTVQWHSAVGLVFSPGSEVVVLVNAGDAFELVGYLTPTSF